MTMSAASHARFPTSTAGRAAPPTRARHAWAGHRLVALCLLLVLLSIEAAPAQAQRTFARRFPASGAQPVSTRGDIVLIGNTSLSCATGVANCATAQDGTTANATNNMFAMAVVDVDASTTTTNSSRATLSLPAGSTVLFAGLYWAGQTTTAAARASVLLQAPGSAGYATVTANATDAIGNAYQSFANVTSQVSAAGNGAYTVGNVAVTAGSGQWAGWTLVVAYQNLSTGTLRNLSVFDGFQLVNGTNPQIDITVSGFFTPSTGPVNSNVGAVLYDGDRGVQDSTTAGQPSLLFGQTTASLTAVSNAVNPVSDVFNSTVSFDGNNVTTGRTPNYSNTLGIDIDVFQPNTPLPNGATSAVARISGSSGDVNYPGIITLATDVFEPNVIATFNKTASTAGGPPYKPGDEVVYAITLSNTGNDTANNVVVTDTLPAGVTYVPGSLVVQSGPNAGPKTDAAGDDQVGISGNQITFRVGTGANGTAGGSLTPAPAADSATELRFRVRINAGTPDGIQINNVATINYTSATTGQPSTGSTPPATIAVSNQADLTITKTNTPAAGPNDQAADTVVTGSTANYSIVVSNAGPSPADGAVVRDPAPTGLICTSATCGTPVNGAVCPAATGAALLSALQSTGGVAIPTLPNAGAVTFTLTCTVQ